MILYSPYCKPSTKFSFQNEETSSIWSFVIFPLEARCKFFDWVNILFISFLAWFVSLNNSMTINIIFGHNRINCPPHLGYKFRIFEILWIKLSLFDLNNYKVWQYYLSHNRDFLLQGQLVFAHDLFVLLQVWKWAACILDWTLLNFRFQSKHLCLEISLNPPSCSLYSGYASLKFLLS